MSPEDNRFYREPAEEPDEDFSAMMAALEPIAIASRPDHDGQLRLSMAISLKRIADTLDGTTAGVCITETIFGGRNGG